jgi:glycosyltransferase involved in cell wall biosynthesis
MRPTPAPRKKRILAYSDFCGASTGFGVVSKHILRALYNTGRYEIDQLAINYFGDFYDRQQIPYVIVPAKLKNPQDPYGSKMFLESVAQKDYDYVLIINDTFVVEAVAAELARIREEKRSRGKSFKIIYYYPVDCKFLESAATMVRIADRAVAYTKFAAESTREVILEGRPTDIIYHGVDTTVFRPLPPEEKRSWRAQYLRQTDPEKFILINVNRNSIRKDIARTILAYSEFKKKVPNSLLYLHTLVRDGVNNHIIDLSVPCKELGLDPRQDVVFPVNYSAAKGFPEVIVNRLYNCGNAFISNHLGEGYGLSIIESMACKLPVIVPNNTVTPEIVGKAGYVYDCKELVYCDNSGFRKWGRMENILGKMFECYEDWKTDSPRLALKKQLGLEFTQKYTWRNVCKDWVKLFAELDEEGNQSPAPGTYAEVL